MPRLMLTDEEAALIEKIRIKNTAAIAFNEGLDHARLILRGIPTETLASISSVEERDKFIADLEAQLQKARRPYAI